MKQQLSRLLASRSMTWNQAVSLTQRNDVNDIAYPEM